jgi:hypothetical protein
MLMEAKATSKPSENKRRIESFLGGAVLPAGALSANSGWEV